MTRILMMNCHRVISYNGRCLISVQCHLHKVSHEGDLFRPAFLLRNLFYLYDRVATLNLTTREMILLTQPKLKSGLRKLPLAETLQRYHDELIHPADKKRFVAFFDLKTLKARVEKAKMNSIAEAFRSIEADGSLVWKTHRVARMASSTQDIFFCVVRVSDAQDIMQYGQALGIRQYTLMPENIPVHAVYG